MKCRQQMSYSFQQAKQDNVSKIYLYDDITKQKTFNWSTWEEEESETSAAHFKELLDEIPEGNRIELHINSAGGSVSEGTTIYNLLREHKAEKTGIVEGICHSIAFTILQGCDWRIMGDGTSAIIHEMWTKVEGNAEELRRTADRLDSHMESCIQLYLKRGNVEEGKLREMLKAETALTPKMALEYGFIDQIGVEETNVAEEEEFQHLLKENKQLKQKIKNDDFMKEQFQIFLKDIRQQVVLAQNQKTKEPSQKSTGFDAFFNKRKGE